MSITREEHVSVTGFCGQYTKVFLTQNSHFSLMKLGHTRVLKTAGIGGILIGDILL
jgi:hypothetical protein